MSEAAWKSEEPVDGIGPYFCGTRWARTLIQITAPDGRALFVECRCSPPNENAAEDLKQRRGVAAELVRACNAHDDLVAALRAMTNTHGMHGPCTDYNCRECTEAYDAADELLAKIKADAR